MYIELSSRHHGVHKALKHIEIPCNFEDVYKGMDRINEELLLKNIPDGWLPVHPSRILLTVGNESGSTGQCTNGVFRTWGKYFDAYVLDLLKEPLKHWRDKT